MVPNLHNEITKPVIIEEKYFKDVGQACTKWYMDFGGAYSPKGIQILAPLFVRFEEAITVGNLEGFRIQMCKTNIIRLANSYCVWRESRWNKLSSRLVRVIQDLDDSEILEPNELVSDNDSIYIKLILKYRELIIDTFT